jgi:hypothetical protein
VLRWIVELGRIDVHIHTAMMSAYMMQPREGHLKEVLHMFAYLKYHPNAIMIFDDLEVQWDSESFPKHDWTNYYRDAKEKLPPNMPEPQGNPVKINCFIAPILWYSKAQSTIESSTFGAEFVATKIAVELIEGLRYKLRMFGIPIEGPANTFVDNNSVILNATTPTSTLKCKQRKILLTC